MVGKDLHCTPLNFANSAIFLLGILTLTTKKQMKKFSSANFQRMLSPSCVIEKSETRVETV